MIIGRNMKSSHVIAVSILFGLTVACAPLEAQSNSPDGPVIAFDSGSYNFGKVGAGEFVTHTYIVTNTGTGVLEITNVHPACGCTTAAPWTRHIAPGQTGSIPIKFNSTHYTGHVIKTIDVYSNARNQPHASLLLTGVIWKPIDVMPQTAVINVPPDSSFPALASVRIINEGDQPLTVSDPVSSSKKFSAELKTTKPGKEYELVVSAPPPFNVGNISGMISLKTSLPTMPNLNVNVIVSVQAAVQVSPSQLMLGPCPDRWTTNRIFIHGNGTNLLTLSEPACSDSRIQVSVLPIQPSRSMYNLVVALPPNYQIEAAQSVVVTVKSNNPKLPVVT